MELKREEDICNHIAAWLKRQGTGVEREVVCGNGIRADLVTPDTVIEVKRYLNRGALYQAYGQGVAYQKQLNKPKLLIIGLAPPTEAKYQEAQRIAENIRQDGVEVVFLDKDPGWVGALTLPTAEVAPSSVRLPFEPEAPASQPKSKTPAASQPNRLPGLTMRDFWTLLILILLFLTVRSQFLNSSRTNEPTSPTQPEVTVP
jgi:hypothetical protein